MSVILPKNLVKSIEYVYFETNYKPNAHNVNLTCILSNDKILLYKKELLEISKSSNYYYYLLLELTT